MVELMEDSYQQVQLLATEFGNHSLVREMQQDQVHLEEDAHDADMLIDLYTMETDQDWVEGWDTVDTQKTHSQLHSTDATHESPSQLHSTAWGSKSSPQGSTSVLGESMSGWATCTVLQTETPAYQAGTETPACQNGTKTPACQAGPVDSLQSEDTKMHQENCTVPRQFLTNLTTWPN